MSSPWLSSPVRRGLDVVIAGSILILGSPIILVTAIAVRVRLGSPVLFRQQRSGRHGVPIAIVKVRSMTDERDAAGELLPDARRLTPLGRLLRSTSLDELPQLWSVVRGDMSLIGPRPLPVHYLDRYTPHQRRRLEATPGISGFAQVEGRNGVGWSERLDLDVWYVDNATPRVDASILQRTVWAVLTRADVSSDGHVTMPEFTGDG